MNNRNHKRARVLILIPIVVFVVTALCLIPLTISYFSTGEIIVYGLEMICTIVAALITIIAAGRW